MPPQPALFPELSEPSSRVLPVIGEQKDIHYVGTLAKSILNTPEATRMGYWSINPYIGCAFGCAYCYARYAHRYVVERSTANAVPGDAGNDFGELPPWLAFERRIFVKQNAADVLRRTLRQGSARHLGLVEGEALVIGTATDPYQPAERRYRVTRGLLEVVAEHPGIRLVIITKSPLITRDIDLLTRIMRHGTVSVHLSLITLDRDLARRLEPRAPTPEARLLALGRLRAAGIDAGINCMPVLPGITDDPAALEALVKRVTEVGATYVSACALRLRREARERYLPVIAREFPHLSERYQRAYSRGDHVSDSYQEGLRRFFTKLCAKYGVPSQSYDDDDEEAAGRVVDQLGLELG
jgi:DNA repair photolyase